MPHVSGGSAPMGLPARAVMFTAMLSVVLSQPHCNTTVFCDNGATCVETMTSARCLCPLGFSGTTCSERDFCSETPCDHHGKCVTEDMAGSYSCHCDPQYLGLQCEQHVSQRCREDENEDASFCTCDVDGTQVRIPLRSPSAARVGVHSRDVLMGLSGLLIGWLVGTGAMTLWRCCGQGSAGCLRDGCCTGVGNARHPLRVSPAPSTSSDLDSLRPDSAESGRSGSSGVSAGSSDEGNRTINVYRAGFTDGLAHQTAVRKSANTYATGQKDW